MKIKRYICYSVIVLLCALSLTLGYINKSYAFGLTKSISGTSGARTIIYTDLGTESNISWNNANAYFGIPMYEELKDSSGKSVYFYKGKETTYNEYLKGSSAEDADNRATSYGKYAYRVRTTAEFKKAIDDIYQNLRIGEFHVIFSKYEAINIDEVYTYYKSKYGLKNPNQNYYSYSVKGMWEPERFAIDTTSIVNKGEWVVDSSNIRITGNDRVVAEKFADSLLPYLYQTGTDYQKILAAYTYLTTKNTYYTYDMNSYYFVDAPTSIYHGFINRKTDCIGWSIAFSYLMDKMGIESYIVDNITYVNEATRGYSSQHTYNVVKLNGKFYKLDITARVFLGGISSTTLYDSSLNISTSAYSGTTSNVTIDYNKIDSLLATAKQTKTTTTAKLKATTTTKTYPYEMPNGGSSNKTTASGNKTTTNSTLEGGTTTTSSREIYPWEEETTTYTGPTFKSTTTTTTKKANILIKEDEDGNKKFNYNLVLIPLLIISIVALVVLRIINIKKNKKNKEITIQNENNQKEGK